MNEFDLIQRYFSFSLDQNSSVLAPGDVGAVALGVGDDCALINVPGGHQLAVTTDTLVEGVHFPAGGNPSLIARRGLRVNLSDLAAMGATPLGFQLALTLPHMDESWLKQFSEGLAADARHFSCPLIGGDTTRGPLSITLTLLGAVPLGGALTRSGARAGDLIGVSGTLGDAALALQQLSNDSADSFLNRRYWLPEPRLALGSILRRRASAGLDISDGLAQDVGHIARGSGLTAIIDSPKLPLSIALRALSKTADGQKLALSGGDDYEICFTASQSAWPEIVREAEALGCAVTSIGHMQLHDTDVEDERAFVRCLDSAGQPMSLAQLGYDHFHD